MAKVFENTYGITRYELIIESQNTFLRFYATHHSFVKGFSNIERIPTATPKPKTLTVLRKHGQKQAALFGVPFIDRTGGH